MPDTDAARNFFDLSGAEALSLGFNSWGDGGVGIDPQTGYLVTVTLTGAGGATLSQTFSTGSNAWSTLSVNLAGWSGASSVSRIEVEMHTTPPTGTGGWPGSFQIDNVVAVG